MKIETAAIITKGACFMTIGVFSPLASGLSQWIEGGSIPTLNWIVIGAACCVSGATQMLAFLSQSFGTYKAEMSKTNGNGSVPTAHV